MARPRKPASASFDAITIEGGLITATMLASINARNAGEQKEEDYAVPKGLTLRDEIARYFRIGQALFRDLTASATPSPAATTTFVESFLRDVLGFTDAKRIGTRNIHDRLYAVTLEALNGRIAFVVVPPSDDLDRVSNSLPTDGRRRSASSALQDWLNANEETLWGLCCNGERIRLVRDNASFTRPAYIEANLRQIFENENFADFTTLWLLMHASRFGIIGTPVSDCALERWREAGSKEGVAARDRLRDGVEAALLALGNGFLAHPHNSMLRERLGKGELQLNDYFGQLLRLVYRLIFLLAAEDRNLLHPPFASASVRKLYADGYSLACLRNFSVRRSAWDRHHDRWEGLLITFSGLSEGEPRLGLPALGGLFSTAVIPDLEIAHLSNRALMEAVYKLAWLKEPSGLMPVNWRDMETEELGSVYESLLELTPRLTDDGRNFTFAEGTENKGNTRKTTGSYYTPDSLVQALLDTALDPILDRIESESKDPAAGLLSVTTVDPACGSGHFLLATARRIAGRLARVRAGGVASADDYRHALRDVVKNCVYGVDRNPMAVELTKVALWIETVEPGKPLGFLDANIRCGDALLGVFDLEALRQGIPDAAYKALSGDDKDNTKYFERRNKAEKGGQGTLDLTGNGNSSLPPPPPLAGSTRSVRALPEDTVKEIAEKKRRFDSVRADPKRIAWQAAADMYMAAFLISKIGDPPINQNAAMVPTTAHVWQALSEQKLYEPLIQKAKELAIKCSIFHWPLEFPDIIAAGGFDVVLGNPPWERIKLQEQEFFAAREPEIAEATNAAARKKMIAALKAAQADSRERVLYEEFELAKRLAEASSVFARESGRFPLTGCGDINTYALFMELFVALTNVRGRAGIIVPTGIATDESTSAIFGFLVSRRKLASLFDFENRLHIFQGLHTKTKFCLITVSNEAIETSTLCFMATGIGDLADKRKVIEISADGLAIFNPNSKTTPIFRSKRDAELTTKIYKHSPIFIPARNSAQDLWNVLLSSFFHMSNDSELFLSQETDEYVELYEAKMFWHFDHRWATFISGDTANLIEEAQKMERAYSVSPRYWVSNAEVKQRFDSKDWGKKWLFAFRNVSDSRNERTFVATVLPWCGLGHSASGIMLRNTSPALACCLLANLNALVLDFVARQKIPGMNVSFFMVEQFPILSPLMYTQEDISFISSRVLELTYTADDLQSWAHDLGYKGKPFAFDLNRRSKLRTELDAYYAKLYGLNRDDLQYILDPAVVMGEDYPSETFRVLKENETNRYGEYRTARLVMEAWDKIVAEAGQVVTATDPATLPDGAWGRPSDGSTSTLAQLAAIIKALPQPTPIPQVRLAALYALEPQYLTNRLSDDDRNTWLRLVGQAAQPHTGATVTAFTPRINAGWRDAVVQLRGMGAIIEDVNAQTWMQGPPVNQFDTETWPDGRARFVLKMLKTISINEATTGLPAEDQAWIANAA